MHNETDLESQDESVDSDTENRTKPECYDGDVYVCVCSSRILKIIIL